MPRIKVIAIGNEMRGDDAVGPCVLRQLGAPDGDVALETLPGDGTHVMEAFQDAEKVILVDAVRSGGRPGTIYRFDAAAGAVPASFFHYSTHAFGLAEAVEMARALNTLPPEVVIFGVEGSSFGAGEPLSPEVRRAVAEVASRIAAEIAPAHPNRSN
jgi:hydrogenase maturation protease